VLLPGRSFLGYRPGMASGRRRTPSVQNRNPSTERHAPATILGVFKAAWNLYRRRFIRIAITAIAVFTPIGMIEAGLHAWSERAHLAQRTSHLVIILILTPVVGFLSMFGEVFFTGVLDESVGADFAERLMPGLREIAARLPWVSLFVADFLVSVLTQIGTEALIIPGMVLFTAFSIVGPIVNIERLGPVESLMRSAKLVWPHFWTAAVCVLIPTTVLTFVGDWFVEAAGHTPFISVLLLAVLLSMSLAAWVGLTAVVLAHALVTEDREKTSGAGAR
jgi:hypothetical protein